MSCALVEQSAHGCPVGEARGAGASLFDNSNGFSSSGAVRPKCSRMFHHAKMQNEPNLPETAIRSAKTRACAKGLRQTAYFAFFCDPGQ